MEVLSEREVKSLGFLPPPESWGEEVEMCRRN